MVDRIKQLELIEKFKRSLKDSDSDSNGCIDLFINCAIPTQHGFKMMHLDLVHIDKNVLIPFLETMTKHLS